MAKRAVKICKEDGCKNQQTTMGYCRLHYLKNWKTIRAKQKKKAAENLNKYVEHIMRKHPDSFVDAIKHDLSHAQRFQRRADEFSSEDEFGEMISDVDLNFEVDRIVSNLKVDDIY